MQLLVRSHFSVSCNSQQVMATHAQQQSLPLPALFECLENEGFSILFSSNSYKIHDPDGSDQRLPARLSQLSP